MKTRLHKTAQDQNLVDIFVHELDSIYYPGYAEDLAETDPVKYDWEFKEFKAMMAPSEA